MRLLFFYFLREDYKLLQTFACTIRIRAAIARCRMKAAGHAARRFPLCRGCRLGKDVGSVSWEEDFYNSGAWRRKRERILRRDKYLCVECRRYGRRGADGLPIAAVTVHHIVPLEIDPTRRMDNDNLQSLCKACHNKKHPEKGSPPGRRRGTPRGS